MPFTLPALPFALDALAPHISTETLEFHHGKHHQAYVTNLNNLTEGKPEASQSLDELVRTAEGGVFNNAAQVWNHSFYFKGLKPGGGGTATGAIGNAITTSFGSFDAFTAQFTKAATTLFGSGWCWLVKNAQGGLEIVQTQNAQNPLRDGKTPLLTCDVWEHAYYVDYRNARPKYVEAWFHLINWDAVNALLG
ncbi:MAG: superoxide dismutase [Pseudomonadota bacterium]